MIRRALYHIAGVDRATIETCPATDKVWAAHLGFALSLSFIVVLGIAFHATGYMIADPWLRGAVALVIALTVFMFDRALYQSDWFYQGFLWQSPAEDPAGGRASRRLMRITIRLAMSFGLAWVIAVFLELAIFSDTISDKIKRDNLAANQPIYQRVEQYQAEVGAEIEARRRSLAALEAVARDELAAPPPAEAPEPAQLAELAAEIRALDAQENALRADLRQIQENIRSYAADMNAEQLGQRINAANSGRAGAGPRYQFARQQKEVYEAQATAREAEIAALRAKRDDLRAAQTRVANDATARRDQARAAVQGRRDTLQAQLEQARADLKALEATRLTRIEDFRAKALAASDFQKLKDDPLSRMTAYQELKNDPKDGDTITLFSWMTKFLVIFLEIVPVVAKLFFSPPSAYAARIQAEVARERRRILRELEAPAADDVEARMAALAADIAAAAKPAPAAQPAPAPAAQAVPAAPVAHHAAPSLVPPLRTEPSEPAPPPARQPDASEREAERRREMEQLISDEVIRQAGARAPARRPAEPPRRESREPSREPSSLGFVLQDDIPQKP